MVINLLSIVIPVFNEGNTIRLILNKIDGAKLVNNIAKEVIIVNDCSTDNTEEMILEYIQSNPSMNIIYKKHNVNKGKGAALHTGIKIAKGECLIIQDADLEYDPNEYDLLLKPV